MRTLIFLTSFFALNAINAQFTLAVKGGWNGTTGHNSNGLNAYGNYTFQSGWQTGVQVEYGFRNTHWLLYSGFEVDKKVLLEKGNRDTTSYKPTFLTVPLGMGYNYAFTKSTRLRLYTGFYGSVGVGGKYFVDEISLTPEWVLYNKINRKISFGNSSSNDLLRTNWGAQFGIGIKTSSWFELACFYDLGLSNILPNQGVGEKLYLRSLSLDLKVDIKTFATTNKK